MPAEPDSSSELLPAIADPAHEFDQFANDWWDPRGKMRALHEINPIRLKFIKQQLTARVSHYQPPDQPPVKHSPTKQSVAASLAGITICDVGCGGGLLSESLARHGARVTGIDISQQLIEIAKAHAREQHLEIDYHCFDPCAAASNQWPRPQTSNNYQQSPQHAKGTSNASNNRYDCILLLELLEHLSQRQRTRLVRNCCKQLASGGLLIVSTINKTLLAWLQAVVIAESLLRWLPRGTHHWHNLVRPAEVMALGQQFGLTARDCRAIEWRSDQGWQLARRSNLVNYIMCLQKNN